jgi:hypothetical protein
MNSRVTALVLAAFSSLSFHAAPAQSHGTLPPSSLSSRVGGRWVEWWRADAAPARWSAPASAVEHAVTWHALAPGLDWGEASLAGSGEAWRIRLILVRLDPKGYRFRLEAISGDDGRAAWSVERAEAGAQLAVNAGQFDGARPWGWIVHGGSEAQAPRPGPLSMAFTVDSAGAVRFVAADSIAEVRARGGIVEAFQSYPTLLTSDGDVPAPLADTGRGVDVTHRDSRLAMGMLRDGRVLIALTRFDALGKALGSAPFGLTVPELAAVMGALGCRQAVALDGGLSSQLLLRTPKGKSRSWRGWRRVPMGLVALPRSPSD